MELVLKLAGLFFTSFVIGFSGAIMPGPLLTVTLAETPRRGAWTGPLMVLGHAMLEGGLVAAIALGLASFLQNELVIGLIALAGGGMLFWMGQAMLRSAPHLSLEPESAVPEKRLHPIVSGILASISNPYWTLWWATIGFSYIVIGLEFGVIGVVVFFLGHILADLVWYSLISVGLTKGKRLMGDRFYRGLLAFCGVALIGFGLWFVVTGVRYVNFF
ncbi:MAG: LysE family transporter [Candidatus Lernaella stagnicola]|nr:LysE family transporter [Candidatus Lernaella stagnicola]